VADILQQAAAWLDGMRATHLVRTVAYRRGAESVDLDATIGKTIFEIDDGSGATATFESRDFLILAADLVIGAGPVEPQAGDKIAEVLGAELVIYEVMAPGREPCWRYSDPYRITLRIHTKQVDVE